MTWALEVSPEFRRDHKARAKDAALMAALEKKLDQIRQDPLRFKPLRKPLQGLRRVHIGSFVLVFEPIRARRVVRLLRFAHHDEAYGI